LGLFIIVGFFASTGVSNLIGTMGPVVSVGSAIQLIGVVVAAVAGVVATVRALTTARR
jgi:hypothetical protein